MINRKLSFSKLSNRRGQRPGLTRLADLQILSPGLAPRLHQPDDHRLGVAQSSDGKDCVSSSLKYRMVYGFTYSWRGEWGNGGMGNGE